nr:reverse transcriptase domain-containing protein [Tanacetum cinerariifolium]
MKINETKMRAMQTQMHNMKSELQNEFKSSLEKKTNKFDDQNNQIMNMLTNLTMQRQSPSGLGSLPSNTVANPRGEIEAITIRSGIVLDGPPVPHSFKEIEQEPKMIMDPILTESTTRPPIPYPSRMNKEKLQDKSAIQIHKFIQMFKKLHFNINLAKALALMPKYHKMLKDLLFDKEKLLGLANTSLTENCSSVLLKKLPEKLRDPGRFLIPCDFHGLELCMALVDLGASINSMPLFVWKKLSLPNFNPTRMTLELATRSIAYPVGIAEDLCVQVGKFTFLDEDDSTSKHPHKHGNESINMINFIDITCEDRFLEVLKIKISNHPLSGGTTPLFDSFPIIRPLETSDSLLEEFVDELALRDPFPPGNENVNFDPEADLRQIEYLLNQDPSTESDIEIIDPILERFASEPALVYSPLLGYDDDDDLFDLKSNNDEWKKLFDSPLIEESSELSEITTLTSSPFGNKDKVFNPGILILGGTQIFNDESKVKDLKDKDLILEDHNFLLFFSYQEFLFHLDLTVIETLLSFSSDNEDKVFNPGILTSKGDQSFTLG